MPVLFDLREQKGLRWIPMIKANRTLKLMAFVAIGIQPAGLVAGAQTAANADSAGESYKKNCSMCHAADGSGTTIGKRLHTPDLRSKEVQEKTSTVLAQSIISGKNNMPAFGTKLGSDEIQSLVEYIRQFHDDTADHSK
jgi:cytochrome c6